MDTEFKPFNWEKEIFRIWRCEIKKIDQFSKYIKVRPHINRFDSPDVKYKILYCTEDIETCFLEITLKFGNIFDFTGSKKCMFVFKPIKTLLLADLCKLYKEDPERYSFLIEPSFKKEVRKKTQKIAYEIYKAGFDGILTYSAAMYQYNKTFKRCVNIFNIAFSKIELKEIRSILPEAEWVKKIFNKYKITPIFE